MVYLRDTTRKLGQNPKLRADIWQGPGIIIKRFSDLLFEVKLQAKGRSKILHHDRLKPYTSSQVPEWLQQLHHSIKQQTRSSEGQIAAAASKAQPGALPPDLDTDPCGAGEHHRQGGADKNPLSSHSHRESDHVINDPRSEEGSGPPLAQRPQRKRTAPDRYVPY